MFHSPRTTQSSWSFLSAFLPSVNLNLASVAYFCGELSEAHPSGIARWLQRGIQMVAAKCGFCCIFGEIFSLWMFTGPAGMYSISLRIGLVNGVALPLTSCDKSLNNGSMEMECGDKCGTCRESETSTWRLSEQKMCRLSLCCTCRQNNYFINKKNKMVREHRCNTVGADPRTRAW